MPATFLIAGTLGGLRSGVLKYLMRHTNSSADQVIASSTRAEVASDFSSRGIAFRHADYSNPSGLRSAFEGIDKLISVSAKIFDTSTRVDQHCKVIEAAKELDVGHIGLFLVSWEGSNYFGRFDSYQSHRDRYIIRLCHGPAAAMTQRWTFSKRTTPPKSY